VRKYSPDRVGGESQGSTKGSLNQKKKRRKKRAGASDVHGSRSMGSCKARPYGSRDVGTEKTKNSIVVCVRLKEKLATTPRVPAVPPMLFSRKHNAYLYHLGVIEGCYNARKKGR